MDKESKADVVEQEIKSWETSEINPAEIAEALRGTLVQREGLNSSYDIHLNYGRRKPLLTLMLDPEKRSIFVAVPAFAYKGEQAYRSVSEFANIELLRFYQYQDIITEKPETNILILVRNAGTKPTAAGCTISSHAHTASISLPKNKEA